MSRGVNSSFVRKIVRHYLKYDRDNPFIFISALMAFLGIVAGVMVMMIAMAVTNGMQEDFKKRLFVMNYPLTLVSYGEGIDVNITKKITKKFPSLKLSPYYTTQVIAKNEDIVQGCMVYAVDFKKEAAINEIFAKAEANSTSTSKYRAIIGDDLRDMMNATVGKKLLFYFSEQQAIGFGSMPLQKRFLVDSTFDSGLKAYDKAIVYVPIESFYSILKKDKSRYDGVHIYSDEPMKMLPLIQAILPDDIGIEGWWQQNGSFFAAMQLEKQVYFLVLLFIILVASLNIISSLLMTVMSRRSEIALMRTLGATKREIRAIFFKLGIIIGASGIAVGVVFGAIGMYLLKTFDIISLPADVYGSAKLPIDLPMSDFVMILVGASVIVILSALYPAKKASSTDPLSVLRNE